MAEIGTAKVTITPIIDEAALREALAGALESIARDIRA